MIKKVKLLLYTYKNSKLILQVCILNNYNSIRLNIPNATKISKRNFCWTKCFERLAIKQLLSKVRSREIDGVVVKDFSRFGRNYLELGDYLEHVFPFL